MTTVRLLVLGLLLHELLGTCKTGRGYLAGNLAPTLGLRVSPSVVRGFHGALILGCMTLLVWPTLWVAQVTLLVVLSLVIASYPARLSNHLALSWFLLAVLFVDAAADPPHTWWRVPSEQARRGWQGIVLLTYAVAFLHKLNRDYLSLGRSCALRLSQLYWEDRGVRCSVVVRCSAAMGTYGAVLLEGGLPLLLGLDCLTRAAVLAGVALHFAFGMLCVMHFSTVMYAGLLAFFPYEQVDEAVALLVSAPSATAVALTVAIAGGVWRLAPTRPYRHARWVRLPQLIFALLTAGVVFVVVQQSPSGTGPVAPKLRLAGLAEPASWAVWLTFLFNGLCPYFGLKTEFSLAMFSNLRHEPWRHLLLPRREARSAASYVRVLQLSELPTPTEVGVDADATLALEGLSQWRTSIFSSYFFHEAMRCLAAGGHLRGRTVAFVEGERRFEVSGDSSWPSHRFPPVFRANLFPYLLPQNPEEPHCK